MCRYKKGFRDVKASDVGVAGRNGLHHQLGDRTGEASRAGTDDTNPKQLSFFFAYIMICDPFRMYTQKERERERETFAETDRQTKKWR